MSEMSNKSFSVNSLVALLLPIFYLDTVAKYLKNCPKSIICYTLYKLAKMYSMILNSKGTILTISKQTILFSILFEFVWKHVFYFDNFWTKCDKICHSVKAHYITSIPCFCYCFKTERVETWDHWKISMANYFVHRIRADLYIKVDKVWSFKP